MKRTTQRASDILRFAVILSAFLVAGCGGDSDGDDGLLRPIAERGDACGGLLGIPCATGLYCDVEDLSCGAADQTGICKTRPEVCAEVFAPVCGCDDKTYGNACEAAAQGISLSAQGECK